MGIFNPEIHIHIHHHATDAALAKLDQIMSTLQELKAKVDQLQSTLDTEQEQMRAKITELEGINAQPLAQVADGGTPEERQALSEKLNAVIEDIKSTIPDVE